MTQIIKQVTPDEADTLVAAELTKQLNDSGMSGVSVIANHTLTKLKSDTEEIMISYDMAVEELKTLRDIISKYRDLRMQAEMTKDHSKVDTFLQEIVIPGVNGPRPEHAHLDRDTAQSIIKGKEALCGRSSEL